jgi:sugar phosphate isomerase/epimerase
MKLGVFTVLFSKLGFERMLEEVRGLGLECIEVGAGAYPGNAHCDADALLSDASALSRYRRSVEQAGLFISALCCAGNPLHPNREIACAHREDFRKSVLLAERLDVPVVNVLSGCPGDSENAHYPNWAAAAWPPDYPELLVWQWNHVAIPYWREAAAFAASHGRKIAVEMHPGFLVYNPETALRLRAAAGENLGFNLDPSHLFWLGIDVPTAVHALNRDGGIFHVHAKDVFVDPRNVAVNGVLDSKPYTNLAERSWTFRTVGWGHGLETWRAIVSALRVTGYDYVLSIEHEDALASIEEGLGHAISFLRSCLLKAPKPEVWWT